MRARLVSCPAVVDAPSTPAGEPHPLMARILRGTLAVAGLAWICFASTLCGCGSVNGYVMNESGKAYYRRGDYTAARHEFERALMDSPENPNYAYNVAAAMQQQGDAMAAERMYQHALVIDPSHEQSYEGLAHLLYKNDRTGEAEQLLTAWSETQPYDENASLALGRMHDNMGNSSAADMAYDRALAANPMSSRLNHELGGRRGRRRDAALAYQRGMMQNPYDFQPDAQMYGQSPALQMAQQMPLYDPTFQPGPMPFQSFGPAPSVPTPPYIGAANLAQQSPAIYQGSYGPAPGGMLPPSYQWGTPATVPLPPATFGNAGMIAAQPAMSGGAFFAGAQAPTWSTPLPSQPTLAPQFAPSAVMPAGGPTLAQPQVVPAF